MNTMPHRSTSLEQQRDQYSSSESHKSSPSSIINTSTDADFQRRSNGSILTHNRLKMTKLFYAYSRWFEFHQNSPHLEKKMTRASFRKFLAGGEFRRFKINQFEKIIKSLLSSFFICFQRKCIRCIRAENLHQ